MKQLLKLFFICLFVLSVTPLIGNQGKMAKVNELDIWYETFGNENDPVLLLIMGGGCQGVLWPVEFCEKLVKEGFHVIRYDHRDAGLSTHFNFAENPYDIMDITKDAIGLIDFLDDFIIEQIALHSNSILPPSLPIKNENWCFDALQN